MKEIFNLKVLENDLDEILYFRKSFCQKPSLCSLYEDLPTLLVPFVVTKVSNKLKHKLTLCSYSAAALSPLASYMNWTNHPQGKSGTASKI